MTHTLSKKKYKQSDQLNSSLAGKDFRQMKINELNEHTKGILNLIDIKNI